MVANDEDMRKMLQRVKLFQAAIDGSVETEIRYEDTTLMNVGSEANLYAVYWTSLIRPSSFLEIIERVMREQGRVPISSETECLIYTKSRPENVTYKYFEVKTPGLDSDCIFLRVYTENFDFTWHIETQSPERITVGIIADKLNMNIINQLFNSTSSVRMPEEVALLLEKLLEKYT